MKLIKTYCDNDNIVIGGQSGSTSVLKKMRRKHTSEDILNSIELTKSAGLIPIVDIIFGNPDENEEEIETTFKFMDIIKRSGAKIHAHTFMPLPGSKWEDRKPGNLSPELKKYLNNLISSGSLFGQWEKQEKLFC